MQCLNKLMLFLINAIACIVGAVVVIVASVVIHKGHAFRDLLSGGMVTLPIIVLLVGLAILLIGSFGAIGALKEKPWLLKIYAFVVVVLVLAELVLGILFFVYMKESKEVITLGMKEAMKTYGTTDNLILDESIDAAQHELQCCGATNFTDWREFTYNGVPDGCCKEMNKGCGANYFNNSSPPEIWEEGCYSVAEMKIEPYGFWLGLLAISLAIIQMICVCCACSIAKRAV